MDGVGLYLGLSNGLIIGFSQKIFNDFVPKIPLGITSSLSTFMRQNSRQFWVFLSSMTFSWHFSKNDLFQC